jgi:hypothetical protein
MLHASSGEHVTAFLRFHFWLRRMKRLYFLLNVNVGPMLLVFV